MLGRIEYGEVLAVQLQGNGLGFSGLQEYFLVSLQFLSWAVGCALFGVCIQLYDFSARAIAAVGELQGHRHPIGAACGDEISITELRVTQAMAEAADSAGTDSVNNLDRHLVGQSRDG